MCGILCSVSRQQHLQPPAGLQELLAARGPDASDTLRVECRAKNHEGGSTTAYATFHSTVLSLRGAALVAQPYKAAGSESILCWNGEAWSINRNRTTGNDTRQIHQLLHDLSTSGSISSSAAVSKALAQVAGPYAFVFFDHATSCIYFGRDFLGRRSLLRRVNEHGDLILSSVADGHSGAGWLEVEADGIYCIHLGDHPDVINSECEMWGCVHVSKAPYQFSSTSEAVSVIPALSLTRQLSSTAPLLDEQSPPVRVLETLLRESLALRVKDIPQPPSPHTHSTLAKLAILFSGGLDCTTLARLSHDLLPESETVDLLNVAFESPRVHKQQGEASYELCPDRITGRASFAELLRVCPNRNWRFVAINIPYTETQSHRLQVLTLMHPHKTEMDLSIAYALYFAARGMGVCSSNLEGPPAPYTTSARVLLSGLGADELFAGYTRHATAFKRLGFDGLLDELDLDISRLGKRNLGRDDRVISHWGREVRFPFLNEGLVGWALAAPLTDKCDFQCTDRQITNYASASIEPGKKILRCLAWRLGMREVSREKKRAIQFGARTAKMENAKTKGTTLLT